MSGKDHRREGSSLRRKRGEASNKQGRSGVDFRKSKTMTKEIQNPICMIDESGEVTLETAEIATYAPTRFQQIGLTITRKVEEPVKEKTTVAQAASPKSTGSLPGLDRLPSDLRQVVPASTDHTFTMTCRRHAMAYSKVDFAIKDNEELCSDVFSYKLGRVDAEDSIIAGVTIPLISTPSTGEDLVMKTNRGQEYVLNDVKVNAERKCFCTVEVDLMSFESLLVVSRPLVEGFSAGSQATTIRSSVDDRVELDIPPDTFQSPTTITMQIIEPPSTSEHGDVSTDGADIVSTSSFYSLESSGQPLTKPVTMQIPLPDNCSRDGDLLVFSMNKPIEAETPESWYLLDIKSTIVGNSLKFDLTSFSIKVAIEPSSRTRRISTSSNLDSSSSSLADVSDMGSASSLYSIQSQISRVFRKARRREFKVSFLCMTRRSGYTNNFRLVIECCKTEVVLARKAHWLDEGYEDQYEGHTPSVVVPSKQRMQVESTNPELELYSDTLYSDTDGDVIEFHPKLDNYQIYSISLPHDQSLATGEVNVTKLEKDIQEGNVSYKRTPTALASMKISLYKFHPSMISELEKKAFLGYQFMVQLQADLQDKWFKILLLMGITFKTIEVALGRKSGSLQEHIHGFLLDWKDINKSRDDCGLPYLLAALKKGGRFELAKDISIKLRGWHRHEQNRNSTFYNWLTEAYRKSSLFDVVDDYPEPMSDLYLVMLASDIKPSEEFFRALQVPDSTVSDVMNNRHVYVTDEMIVMKIFVYFRNGIPDKTKALQKLIEVFESQGMMDKRKYALMSAKAWSRRATDRDDKLKLDIQEFVNSIQ